MNAITPGAFFSYARFDDSRDNGRVSQLRDRLAREVRAQTGDSFEIWQDRTSIQWGEQWKERIDHAIDTLTFLIVVVTPSWFKSAACRGEFERFLGVEKKRGRADLILPIVYIDTPVLNEAVKRGDDPVAMELATRQLFRIDDLRHRKWMPSNIGRQIEQMALAIRDALQRQSTDKTSPGSFNSIQGVSVEFQHVIQTWGHSDFWPDNREDLQEVHLLRMWLVNNERLAANHVEGSVNIPNELAWEQSGSAERKFITVTNVERVASGGMFGLTRSERKPLLPTRRMVVHEERLLFDPALMTYGDHVVSWETGADSFQPTHGETRIRDIPTVDERPAN
ncbi:MAG TPA: toll/interleukin-1 receptor domain-containing protein [Chthoniobacterales bacterium]|nr:toll/interleukin-1 receptor domain-containing protein [Chthoniobacterales bacterium]